MITDLQSEIPNDPVTPTPAATVISLRDTPTGMEVLMVQRTKKAVRACYSPKNEEDSLDNSRKRYDQLAKNILPPMFLS